MIEGVQEMQPIKPDFWVIFWYCLAAISGGLGGCSAAAIISLRNKRALTFGFMAAYMLFGAVVAIMSFGFGHLLGLDAYASTEEVIVWSVLVGAGVPLALFSQNYIATLVLKKLGIEIQVTMRRSNGGKEERRNVDH